MALVLKIKDRDKNVIKEEKGSDYVNLVYDREYKEGDTICLEAEANKFYVIQLDDAMRENIVYITANEFIYYIPFGDKRISYSPKAFAGSLHLITVREAFAEEIYSYRNLAENVYDQHGDNYCYPHASANVETRGEAVFAARNAIDGITENHSHGKWPYQSWGINMQDDAEITVEFGKPADIDRMILYTRADFPHDNWWEKATFTFSDGSKLVMNLTKSDKGQEIGFQKKTVEWVRLGSLIKSNDPSPFPALSQWKIFGVTR